MDKPGWYPDPDQSQPLGMRWWDGQAWTDDTYQRTEPMDDWTQVTESAEPAPVEAAPLASWGRRALARLVDFALVWALVLLIGAQQVKTLIAETAEITKQAEPFVAAQFSTAANNAAAVLGYLLLGISLLLELIFLKKWAATPGKLLLGLRVQPAEAGSSLRVTVILRRWFFFQVLSQMSLPGWIYCVVDVLWPFWSPRRQALHDLIAKTVVVQPNKSR